MEEFKPDSDFRPDSSDRRPVRQSRTSHGSSLFGNRSFSFSRQHLMMGMGIILLLLLVLGVSSALKGPAKLAGTGEVAREITLGPQTEENRAMENAAGQSGSVPTHASQTQRVQTPAGGKAQEFQAPPQVASTPTEAAGSSQTGQRRVELSGDLSTALMQDQQAVDQAVNSADQTAHTIQSAETDQAAGTDEREQGMLPTGPATLSSRAPRTEKSKVKARENQPVRESGSARHGQKNDRKAEQKAQQKIVSAKTKTESLVQKSPKKQQAQQALPKGQFTLQLSGASRPDTLNAFARQHQLPQYRVYETRRGGKPWFILISGAYGSSGEAKKAIASLPAEVRAQQPWVKPMQQVQHDLQQR